MTTNNLLMNLHQYYQIDFKTSEVIIAGDFNINLLKINEREYFTTP